MPVVIHRYRCEWCKKHYSNKYGCQRHESYCYWNPANKTCSTCVHFTGFTKSEHREGYVNVCAIDGFKRNRDEDVEDEVFGSSPPDMRDWFRDCDVWMGYEDLPDLVPEVEVHLGDLDLIDAMLDDD